jgi:hypothetical protein
MTKSNPSAVPHESGSTYFLTLEWLTRAIFVALAKREITERPSTPSLLWRFINHEYSTRHRRLGIYR